MDMENPEFPPKSFDAIVAFHSIYHLPKEKHQKLFEKLNNLLINEGYLLLTSGLKDKEKIETMGGDINMYESHYSKEKTEELLRQTGYIISYSEKHTTKDKEHAIILAKKIKSN
jgi:cyclopropane fatty-acyl-phospholipid synthase-like methyltransferase